MSATDEKELKGGHPPAVKAGGMRITQRHTGPKEPCNVVPDDENNAALKVPTRTMHLVESTIYKFLMKRFHTD